MKPEAWRILFARISRAVLALALVLLLIAGIRDILNEERPGISYGNTGKTAAVTEIPTFHGGDVRVNTDDANALTVLPGIGPAYAQRIVEERTANGPFWFPEDLLSVKGIGVKRLEAIRELLDLTLEQR